MGRHIKYWAAWLAGSFVLSGCASVGPKYHKPTVATPTDYKEAKPSDTMMMEGWAVAQPKDDRIHGKWWQVFNDPELNVLEEQVNLSNQNIAMALANYQAAQALVQEARAQYFPTIGVSPSVFVQRGSGKLGSGTLTTPGGAGMGGMTGMTGTGGTPVPTTSSTSVF